MLKHRRSTILNYFRPSIYLTNFEKLNIFALKQQGFRVLYCDLDNTLVPHFSRKPTQNVIAFLKLLKSQKIAVWLVSNNSTRRVSEFSEKLLNQELINGFIANAKKPLINKIKKHMKQHHYAPADIVFMGDQLITDILAANRLGCKSILVSSLMDIVYESKLGNKRIRLFLERFIYSRLEQNNFLNIDVLNEDFIGGANEIL
ncbi:YqeG family HAD IIIA-type phosphatase [[Mycoplasma] testudinis]|uniref:YqeG family HAD IIIA-type phosphatase n=1 Tax=[Mycoplasma] testudinis TaxID=33924 RepID=UPI000481D9D7|nr:HAD-IIIA family hydrolase [[Mycoplasma] testudinis]